MDSMCDFLRRTRCLTKLALGDNSELLSSSETVGKFARALRENQSLKSLEIDYCGLTDEGLQILMEELKWNKRLQELDITGNELTDRGGLSIPRMLAENKSILNIEFEDGNHLDIGKDVIYKMLEGRL